jgi:hypothetical protein
VSQGARRSRRMRTWRTSTRAAKAAKMGTRLDMQVLRVARSVAAKVFFAACRASAASDELSTCKTGSLDDLHAALDGRRLHDNPAFWAAFGVFCAPERLRTQ